MSSLPRLPKSPGISQSIPDNSRGEGTHTSEVAILSRGAVLWILNCNSKRPAGPIWRLVTLLISPHMLASSLTFSSPGFSSKFQDWTGRKWKGKTGANYSPQLPDGAKNLQELDLSSRWQASPPGKSGWFEGWTLWHSITVSSLPPPILSLPKCQLPNLQVFPRSDRYPAE